MPTTPTHPTPIEVGDLVLIHEGPYRHPKQVLPSYVNDVGVVIKVRTEVTCNIRVLKDGMWGRFHRDHFTVIGKALPAVGDGETPSPT